MGLPKLPLAKILPLLAAAFMVAAVVKETRVMPRPPFAATFGGEACPEGDLGWYAVARFTVCYPQEWAERRGALVWPKVKAGKGFWSTEP